MNQNAGTPDFPPSLDQTCDETPVSPPPDPTSFNSKGLLKVLRAETGDLAMGSGLAGCADLFPFYEHYYKSEAAKK